jgi:hypothetical protein
VRHDICDAEEAVAGSEEINNTLKFFQKREVQQANSRHSIAEKLQNQSSISHKTDELSTKVQTRSET